MRGYFNLLVVKKVLVLGGSGGIGQATIQCIKSENNYVINLSRTPSYIEGVENINLDLSCEYEAAVNLRGLDVIIDCIGINIPEQMHELNKDNLESIFEINLISKFRILSELLRYNSPSKIVIVSSIWGVSSRVGRSVYSASKHGLIGLVRSLALELAPKNCLVNAVSPGFTLTELTKKTNTLNELSCLESTIPMGRLAQPSEIAHLINFLISENNTYITGQNIIIDGGYTI